MLEVMQLIKTIMTIKEAKIQIALGILNKYKLICYISESKRDGYYSQFRPLIIAPNIKEAQRRGEKKGYLVYGIYPE